MDIVYLHDLRIDTCIGVYGWERQIKQTLILDLDMAVDVAKAAGSDDIADTLNYKAVAKRVIQFVSESEYRLVETLAENVANLVVGEFGISWVRLKVNKVGAVRGARDVGVIIERGSRA